MTTCSAPGPDGLRCEDGRTVHAFPHWRGFGPGAWVLWKDGATEPTCGGPIFEMLAVMGEALHAIGDACRAGAR